ncbi:MAG: hypothetical protein H4O13_17505 [Xanthomonadales bacterium]|nr:hypothetical protein [Xanthomonadales bacterium]
MSLPANFMAFALLAIGLFAAARLLWKRPQRWPWRLLLQSLALLLLFFVLNPPPQPLPQAGTLTVLGAGWRDALTHRVGLDPPELDTRPGAKILGVAADDSRDLNAVPAKSGVSGGSGDIESAPAAEARRDVEATVGQDPPDASSAAADVADRGRAGRGSNANAELGPPTAVIALPEAEDPLPPGVQGAPDLATALRMRPEFAALRLFGRGLSLRDLAVARERGLAFFPAPLPRGFVAIEHPEDVTLGAAIDVTAHWNGMAPARVQLLDAAGEALAEQVFDAGESSASSTASGALNATAADTPAVDAAIEQDAMAEASSAAAVADAAAGASTASVAVTTATQPAPGDSTSGSALAPAPTDAASSVQTASALAPMHSGVVRLQTLARAAGPLPLRLRALDAKEQTLDEFALRLDVTPPRALKALLLAAAPGPETRALRRWAVDAGLDFDSRIQFAPGLVQGGRALAPSAEELAALDLLILEERAWSALGAGGRAAVLGNVENGLGLLLRLTALPNPGLLAELREAGFAIERVPGETSAQARVAEAPTRLRQLPIRVSAAQSVPAVLADSGEPLALWRARGLGRLGLLWLTDSYRLQAAGHAEVYGALWSGLTTALARAPAAPPPAPILRLPRGQMQAWLGERIELCGLRAPLALSAPDGAQLTLAAPDAQGCAVALPSTPGRYRLGTAEATALSFEVRDPAREAALYAADLRARTHAAVSSRAAGANNAGPAYAPGDFWPWLLALLAVFAALWWLERPRSP